MKYKKALLVWVLLSSVFLFWDVFRWIVRGKQLSVESITGTLAMAGILVWLQSLPQNVWGIAFLSWIAASIVSFIALLKLEKTFVFPPLADALASYAAEFMPLLVTVGVILWWTHKNSREAV